MRAVALGVVLDILVRPVEAVPGRRYAAPAPSAPTPPVTCCWHCCSATASWWPTGTRGDPSELARAMNLMNLHYPVDTLGRDPGFDPGLALDTLLAVWEPLTSHAS